MARTAVRGISVIRIAITNPTVGHGAGGSAASRGAGIVLKSMGTFTGVKLSGCIHDVVAPVHLD